MDYHLSRLSNTSIEYVNFISALTTQEPLTNYSDSFIFQSEKILADGSFTWNKLNCFCLFADVTLILLILQIIFLLY